MYGKRTKKIMHYFAVTISILMVISMVAMYALPSLFGGGGKTTVATPDQQPTIDTEVKNVKVSGQEIKASTEMSTPSKDTAKTDKN